MRDPKRPTKFPGNPGQEEMGPSDSLIKKDKIKKAV